MKPNRAASVAAGVLTCLSIAAAMPAAAQPAEPRAATGDRWAAVNSVGTLARGKGALSVIKADVGRYLVAFNRSVTPCVYVATIGLTGTSGTSDPGTITTRRATGDKTKVEVKTFDPQGLPVDLSFFLHVVCQ